MCVTEKKRLEWGVDSIRMACLYTMGLVGDIRQYNGRAFHTILNIQDSGYKRRFVACSENSCLPLSPCLSILTKRLLSKSIVRVDSLLLSLSPSLHSPFGN